MTLLFVAVQNACHKLRYKLTVHIKARSVNYKKVTHESRLYSSGTFAPPWNVLFFGTDDFSAQSLEALCNEMKLSTLVGCLDVVTSTKSHRPNSVQRIATREKLMVHPWPLQSVPPGFHVGLVASFGHLIPKKIIDAFPLGVLNVHASLLPRWRGAAPIVYAILRGDTETGVSIMQIRPHRFDVGPVLKQMHCPIGPHETAADVQARLAQIGATALLEVVRHLPQSLECAVPQLESGATYAPKVTPALHCVKWSEMTAAEVYNLCRALGHATSQWHSTTVRLLQPDPPVPASSPASHISVSPSGALPDRNLTTSKVAHQETFPKESIIPGMVRVHRSSVRLRVMCADGIWVAFARVVLPGRKPMSAVDFYNGFLSKQPLNEWILT